MVKQDKTKIGGGLLNASINFPTVALPTVLAPAFPSAYRDSGCSSEQFRSSALARDMETGKTLECRLYQGPPDGYKYTWQPFGYYHKRPRRLGGGSYNKLTVKRRSYFRTNSKTGKRSYVPATTYTVSRTKPYKASRGAKPPAAPYSKERAWIQHPGKLGGPGFTNKPSKIRHELLNKCVSKHGYKSCLGSIMALERAKKHMAVSKAQHLSSDHRYLVDHYGAK